VAQLVRQRARPVVALFLHQVAVAVPDRAHPHVAELIRDLGVVRVDPILRGDAALIGIRAQVRGTMPR
jgi:hypothetical protein